MAALVRDGVLVGLAGGVGWIETTLAPGGSWRDAAATVRRAVTDHVAGTAPRELTEDDLRDLAETVLERDVAPLAGAHGGRIRIVRVAGHTVSVALDGACHGCPAARSTLQDRFQTTLRRHDPRAMVVETAGSAATAATADGVGAGAVSWLPFPRLRGRAGSRR
ncbi:NifU family protein [Kocuria tytonicola]|uniref:NifU family protein n=1 Tax=Kocuria tytonicola TaxID=2055946 RepID=A0A3L9L8T7_9MICC|nr:NifU family protein [Kocuria tytonicola]RLZ03534.1 NifU family protein [Kocuria tytonicola]